MKKERPLSPHLQVYRPQITSISSILHRISGIALMMGLLMVTWGLLALANGREAYEFFIGFCISIPGQILLFGWTAAFFYHLCTGLRHFLLDAGYLYARGTAAASGWVVLAMAVILTAATWACIYRDVLLAEGTML